MHKYINVLAMQTFIEINLSVIPWRYDGVVATVVYCCFHVSHSYKISNDINSLVTMTSL